MANFKRGYDALKEAVEESERGGGSRNPFGFVFWKKGDDPKTIRFLTDGVTPNFTHNFVTCADGKKRTFLCRDQEAFDYAYCVICNTVDPGAREEGAKYKKRKVTTGLVAVRDIIEEKNSKGQIVRKGVDTTHEVEIDGKKKTVPVVGFLSEPHKTFWSAFTGPTVFTRTLVDRDFFVARKGEGLSTRYEVAAMDKDDVLSDEDALLEHYKEFFPDLKSFEDVIDEHLERMGSEDYLKRFFYGEKSEDKAEKTEDPAVPYEEVKTEVAEDTPVEAPQATQEPVAEEPQAEPAKESGSMNDIRSRLAQSLSK